LNAQILGVQWSPDSQTLAVLGRAANDFVAFTDNQGHVSGLFTAPVGATTCFIPGRVEWSRGDAVVPLFGPDCGLDPSELSNALALVDPASGKVRAYIGITRKGFLALSGRWSAIGTDAAGRESTTFFSLDERPCARPFRSRVSSITAAPHNRELKPFEVRCRNRC
jgi:hypothetical protein